jgi:hypothetical protein
MTRARLSIVGGLGSFGLLAALAITLFAREARAYTFVDEIPEDPCARARSFEPQDGSQAAQRARRACRLAAFERRMADERRQAVASEQTSRDAAVEKWFLATQPTRVLRPMAVEVFGGSGIINYGAAFSWNVVRNVELAARVGRREMSCSDQYSGAGADCTRTTLSGGVRWIIGDRDFSPFVGTAFSTTAAPLKVVHYDPMTNASTFLDGKGSAHSVNLSGGLQLATGYVRLSVEYLYEYIFYTGANLYDPMRTPSEDLRTIWSDSLYQDRHGVRFQVGFAF